MITTPSVYATSLAGIQRGLHGLQRAANDIANSTVEGFDGSTVAESLVAAKQHARAIEASTKSIQVTDRALGHLLDVLV